MRKSLLLLLSMLVIFGLLLTACGGDEEPAVEEAVEEAAEVVEEAAEEVEEVVEEVEEAMEEATVLDFWSFTNELNTMAIAFQEQHPEVDVNYTMIPMTNGEYQTKLLASLGTDEAPDVIALEAAFVKEYVESDFLADHVLQFEWNGKVMHWLNDYTVAGASTTPAGQAFDAAMASQQMNQPPPMGQAQQPSPPQPSPLPQSGGVGSDKDLTITALALVKCIQGIGSPQQAVEAFWETRRLLAAGPPAPKQTVPANPDFDDDIPF